MVIKQIVLFGDFPKHIDHHIARWAINIPVYLIQKYISIEAYAYYIWPFVAATGAALFSFLILEKIRNWKVGIAGAALVVLSEPMLRLGTQFLPMTGAVAYLLGMLYFLIRWHYHGRINNLIASCLFLFLGWGAKVTSIYYLPAILFYIYYFSDTNKLKNSFLYLGIFIFLLTIETILFYILYGIHYGRLEIMTASHSAITKVYINSDDWKSHSRDFIQYILNIFAYIIYPGKGSAALLYTAFMISIISFAKKWKNLYAVSIPFVFGFFAHAYAITSLTTFSRPERLLARYQSFLFILSILVLLLFLSEPKFDKLSAKFPRPFRIGERNIRAIFFLALAVPIIIYAFEHTHIRLGLLTTIHNNEIIRAAQKEKRPIFIPKSRNEKYTINRILKYQSIFTTIRNYGHTPNVYTQHINIKERPVINRQGRGYILASDIEFSKDSYSKAVFLERL
jgi:hypothetical protein